MISTTNMEANKMSNGSKIHKIFSASDVKHGISLFTQREIAAVENIITEQDGEYYITCQIKGKKKKAKPEEIVRQLWIYRLLTEYGYPRDRIDVERVIYFGTRDSGLADIVVLDEDKTHPYIIFEVKRPSRTAGLEQLKSYCNAQGAPIGVWTNGNEMIRLHREEPNIFVEIPRIPKVFETLSDVLSERWTFQWLEEHDELKKGKTTLKKILLDLEELVLGNAGVDDFREIFKLIYAKLFDEWKGANNPSYQLEFYSGNRTPEQVKDAIEHLFREAKRQWGEGVFEPEDNRIKLSANHLKVCVSHLEKIKLFNSNLQIIDEAFEHLVLKVSKKKHGQFFTPRPVIDMIVKMLNPKFNEFIIDPACGSCGFTLHSIIWIAKGVITPRGLPDIAKDFAQNRVYGIDFSEDAVKVAKAINLIVGDGKAHVYKANSLAPFEWPEEVKAGLRPRLLRFSNEHEKDDENQQEFLYFDFDILMTNPPFAGTVKEKAILRLYKVAEKKGKLVNKIGRHILFLERSLHFIRPGGRMAIVLPQGLLNNTNAEYIRRFIMDEARILAIVGLHVNTFKPHTGTKTSVLFLRKWTEEEKQRIEEIKTRYESEWEEYISDLRERFRDITWGSRINEDELPEELKSFIETYFETAEEVTEEQLEEAEGFNEEENGEEPEETKGKKTLNELVNELNGFQDVLEEKQIELKGILEKESKLKSLKKSLGRKKETLAERSKIDTELTELKEQSKAIKKVINALEKQIRKIEKEISERTLGGQIYLVLKEEKIAEQFKKYWIDGKVINELDYPIFFAVNEKPVKDNKGEYRYKKGPNGEFIVDEHGHPIIDHDLDEIAEAFVQFAKDQLAKGDNAFDFWE